MNLSHLKLTVALLLLGVESRSYGQHGHLRSSIPVSYPTTQEHTPEAATQWVLFNPGESKLDSKTIPGKSEDDSEVAQLRAENAKLKEKLKLRGENDRLRKLLADTKTGKVNSSAVDATAKTPIMHPIPTLPPVYLKAKRTNSKDIQEEAAMDTTTAAFAWTPESQATHTTTAAAREQSNQQEEANREGGTADTTTAAPREAGTADSATAAPVVEEVEEVEVSTAVSNGTNLTNVTIIRPCNCSNKTEPVVQYNATAVVEKLQQRAQLSAEAAQASLEAINKLGTSKASATAVEAYSTANQAGKIWDHLMTNSLRTEEETLSATEQLKALTRVNKAAANGYTKAVMKVKDFPPSFPTNVGVGYAGPQKVSLSRQR